MLIEGVKMMKNKKTDWYKVFTSLDLKFKIIIVSALVSVVADISIMAGLLLRDLVYSLIGIGLNTLLIIGLIAYYEFIRKEKEAKP